MSWEVRCVEPGAIPAVVEVTAAPGAPVGLWALPEDGTGLRTLLLRTGAALPPPGAALVLELEPRQATGEAVLRVRQVGPEVAVEVARTDHRRRLTAGGELRSGARLELVLADERRTGCTLLVGAAGSTRARVAVAGAGRKDLAVARDRGALWLVPGLWALVIDLDDVVKQNLWSLAEKLGLSTRSIAWLMSTGFFVLSAGALWYMQYQATQDAEDTLAATETELATVAATRDAAVQAEATCLDAREELVARLGDLAAARAHRAERTLSFTLAQTTAVEIGGRRMRDEHLAAFDAQLPPRWTETIADALASTEVDAERMRPCLDLAPVLGTDLPPYVLTWFAEPGQLCPTGYQGVLDGVDVAGRWGLAASVTDTYGEGAADAADARQVDRVAATALAEAVRATTSALLGADLEGRPAVAPSEAHLWALTLFGAWNRVRPPGPGLEGEPLPACVMQLVEDRARGAPPASPGEPVLPSLLAVRRGEIEVPAAPTPGCAWPPDAIAHAAEATVAAVVRAAATLRAEEE